MSAPEHSRADAGAAGMAETETDPTTREAEALLEEEKEQEEKESNSGGGNNRVRPSKKDNVAERVLQTGDHLRKGQALEWRDLNFTVAGAGKDGEDKVVLDNVR
jgi:hypothetical protein